MKSIHRIFVGTVLFSVMQLVYGQDTKIYPFRNPSLPFAERVNDLVSRMTLEEKTSQMVNDAPAIARLGIPAYNWWNECLHGVARSEYKVTVFPQAIGMAATFDDAALKLMGSTTSSEARAINNDMSSKGKAGAQYHGLTFWTPNINIFRDPRWGRGQETYGEDPYLTSRMGIAMVSGLQGDDPKYLKVAACAKHFAVHSGPEPGRNKFNVAVDDYDLWDTYLPAFKALVTQAKVAGVMCAYNRFRGQPCCGNDLLMTDILRSQWHFTGYVTSDCGAVEDFYTSHKTHANAADASADAVLHGTDLECGGAYHALVQAVKNGSLAEKDIDVSVKRLFMIRFRLGMFDPESLVPYDTIRLNVLESKKHRELALKMARESMVLLKNKDGILPLSKKIRRIVVVGPNADDKEILLGNYNGFPTKIITPLEGLQNIKQLEVVYKKGPGYVSPDSGDEQDALQAIQKADVVVFVGGISPRLEGEEFGSGNSNPEGFFGGDRTNVALPAVQTGFMKKIKALGKPLIFVCMSGSAVGFEWEAQNADAILQAWYGGQAAGTAIADVLTGRYNPAGRLPVTFYKSSDDLPSLDDYSMVNRTYRYFRGKPLFPFGYGLSFTKFGYAWKTTPAKWYAANDTVKFSVTVDNVGRMAGDEVLQAYIQYPGGENLPQKELRGFSRVNIDRHKSKIVTFEIPVRDLQKWNVGLDHPEVHRGVYRLFVGSNSDDRRLQCEFKITD
jgi:beta-glucosidase